MSTSVEQRVKEIIQANLKVKDISCVSNDRSLSDLGADSLDSVETLLALEKEFGITITDKDFENMHTVQDAINIVDSKYKGK